MATLVQNREPQKRLFKTNISIPEDKRLRLIELLNARLADSTDLRTQTKHAHWNVKGIEFFQLHELFDSIAEHLDEHVDLIAERITTLGGVAQGTARQAAANSSIEEYDLRAVTGEEHLGALTTRLAKLADQIRGDVDRSGELGDLATQDMLTEILRQLDKDRWFLEAHLQA